MPYDSIPHRLMNQAKIRPDAPAYYAKTQGGAAGYRPTTWREHAEEVKRAGKALIALGFGRGATGCILGFNRPEWLVFDMACMAVGGAPVGIYTTCSATEVQYIIDHAESPIVVVENASQYAKIKKESERLPHLRHIVLMRDAAPVADDPRVMTWEGFLAAGDGVEDALYFERLDALEPGGLATLIYTSGTTGPPKGVMLSHKNLAWTANQSATMTRVGPSDSLLSYLPLSHIAEQMLSIHVPTTSGMPIYFAESIDKMLDNLKEVQPTLFFGVPRVMEKIHAGLSRKLGEATGVKRTVIEQAMRVGREMTEIRSRGGHPSLSLAIQYELASRLLYSKIKPAIGFGRMRVCVCGAAPVAKEVLDFFAGLDITVREVYGQSEDTGPTSWNRIGQTKLGTVGPPYPGVDVKIAADSEILVRGPNVFLGYYKDPEATAETLVDGWLHTGDLGEFDQDGFLIITGRKKDILITAGGKNIAPKNIEGALKGHRLVADAVVIGDRRKYLTVLVTLDPEAAQSFAAERGITAKVHEHPEIQAEVQKAVDEVNTTLARVETVKKFRILPRSFSIEGGELTPSLKIKRKVVAEKYAAEIESMYRE